jgi:hypothetical protein
MKVAQCPVHALVIDAAREEMAAKQRFMKESVLLATGLRQGSWTKSIQWPFVRATIEEELGGELLQPIPNGNGRWDPAIHPEKFLPGARRKTAGYARATSLAPEVAKTWLKRRWRNVEGGLQSFDRLALSYQRQGIIAGYTSPTVPPLQLS